MFSQVCQGQNVFYPFCREYDWALMVLNVIGRGSSTGTLALCYVYSAEIFPTVVRNVGIGSSSVWVMHDS